MDEAGVVIPAVEEPIVFGSGGEQIVGMVHRVPGHAPAPVVVMLHGFTGSKHETRRLFVQAARRLAGEGIATLRFDFRGCGDSSGDFHEMTVNRMIEDTVAAMSWLRTQPDLDVTRTGLLGMSLGGLVASLAARALPDLRGVLLWSPVTNPRRLIAQRTTPDNERQMGQAGVADLGGWAVGRAFVMEMMTVDPVAALRETAIPVRVLHGDADQTVPFEDSVAAVRALQWGGREVALHGLAGAGHGFESLAFIGELLDQTVVWWRERFIS